MTTTAQAGAQAPAARHLAPTHPRHTTHAETPMPDLASRLTDNQLKVLFGGLHASRVGKNQKGFAHVQQWDVRRFLLRVFGFGGYDTELVSIDCVREIQIPAGKDNYGNDKFRWTVVYRVHQRLTVKDIHGRPIATFDGVATGDAQNQPSLGDAHDGAVKEADSQSLKRAAVNLGDAFGLSLYNGGKTDAVVIWSAAHPAKPSSEETPATGLPEDPPVEPEPDDTPQRAEPEALASQAEQPPARPRTVPSPAKQEEDPEDRAAALDAMWQAAREIGFTDGLPAQFVKSFGHPIDLGSAAEFRQARDLMTGAAA
ncbi:Rad52/Rad22 family DNA repair protein [Streptomyces sp. NPDC002659]|uniref:Rad52/Rad22 family DNA repair protein n=1 Tax=Streptomyces sp. NPDC002659 TaxID=3364656 RepID=UPI0036BD89D9